MAFVPVPNTAEIEIRMLLAGQRVENTLWFRHTGTIDTTALNALTAGVFGWWNSDIKPHTSNRVTLREIYGTDQSSETGATSTVDGGGAFGAIDADALANAMSLAVSFRTPLRGRSFRGRNYVVGIPGSSTADANTISSGFISVVVSAYNSLLGADALVTGWTWVVVSRFHGKGLDGRPTPRVEGIPTEITNVLVVDPILDTQRRRGPGRGI